MDDTKTFRRRFASYSSLQMEIIINWISSDFVCYEWRHEVESNRQTIRYFNTNLHSKSIQKHATIGTGFSHLHNFWLLLSLGLRAERKTMRIVASQIAIASIIYFELSSSLYLQTREFAKLMTRNGNQLIFVDILMTIVSDATLITSFRLKMCKGWNLISLPSGERLIFRAKDLISDRRELWSIVK